MQPSTKPRFAKQPGLCIHDVMRLPLDRCRRFFDELRLRAPLDDATALLLAEIRGRLGYLVEVGLGYLTLDRQSRTLSGGEVQRINLTTALGTSLVNTLFVLDEPSIGLHARDIARMVSVLHKLRDAGNTLLVVEHDPGVMLAADPDHRTWDPARANGAARSSSAALRGRCCVRGARSPRGGCAASDGSRPVRRPRNRTTRTGSRSGARAPTTSPGSTSTFRCAASCA